MVASWVIISRSPRHISVILINISLMYIKIARKCGVASPRIPVKYPHLASTVIGQIETFIWGIKIVDDLIKLLMFTIIKIIVNHQG